MAIRIACACLLVVREVNPKAIVTTSTNHNWFCVVMEVILTDTICASVSLCLAAPATRYLATGNTIAAGRYVGDGLWRRTLRRKTSNYCGHVQIVWKLTVLHSVMLSPKRLYTDQKARGKCGARSS
jgi:hypothetical protein